MTTFRFVHHLSMAHQHIIAEVCNEYPAVHREIVTKYVHGRPGKGEVYYFIQGDPNEYRTLADALRAHGVENVGQSDATPNTLDAQAGGEDE